MKKIVLITLSILILIFVSSCKKTEKEVVNSVDGIIIRGGLGLFEKIQEGENSTPTAKYKDSVTIGEKVKINGTSEKITYDKNELDFVKITTESKTSGYVSSAYAIADSELGVIIEDDVVVFTEPVLTKPSVDSIKKMNLVAVHNNSRNGDFIKISANALLTNNKYKLFSEVYIKASSISMTEDDTQSIRFYNMAISEKNATKKKVFSETALKFKNSVFIDEINSKLGNTPTKDNVINDEEIETEDFDGGIFIVNNDKINIRDLLSQNGNVVAQLNTGDEVKVIAKTKKTYTIDNYDSAWFKIEEPKAWVFGAFIDQK